MKKVTTPCLSGSAGAVLDKSGMPHINVYSPEYRDAIIDLILRIQQKEFSIPISREDQPDLLDIPAFYQKGNGNFWAAMMGDRVVGSIALLDIGNSQGALRKMFVDKRFRGSRYGVASALMKALLAWARDKRMTDIFLGTTEKFLAAHRFYDKNGFREISRETLPQSFPVMLVDTRFFHYDLTC